MLAPAIEEWIIADYESTDPQLLQIFKSLIELAIGTGPYELDLGKPAVYRAAAGITTRDVGGVCGSAGERGGAATAPISAPPGVAARAAPDVTGAGNARAGRGADGGDAVNARPPGIRAQMGPN